MTPKVLGDYKVVYKNQAYHVDRKNTEEVAYLFNVLLVEPKCKIYLCYADGTEREICLKKTRLLSKILKCLRHC